MVRIDSTRCNGCGSCVDFCTQQAITLNDNLAVINEKLCIQCGTCAVVCPTGAILEEALVNTKPSKGGEVMTYGYGRGFGRRGGAGFGFRGASSSWPYIGRGRGGLPRCWHSGFWGMPTYPPPASYWPRPTREEEMRSLKDQDTTMKNQLEDIESRIKELENED